MSSLVTHSVVMYPPANAGDVSLIPECGIPPGEENGNHSIFLHPTPVLLPGKSHGWRSPGRLQSVRLRRVGHD